jgi:uncharacterized SAM-binding protein YcdF (DUF218 family)
MIQKIYLNVLPNLLIWLFIFSAIVLWTVSIRKKKYMIIGLIWLSACWFISTLPFADCMLIPLENQYQQPLIKTLSERKDTAVVVLTGGGYSPRGELTSAVLPHASTFRFLGGMELAARLGTDCTLYFSGTAGRGRADTKTARSMKELAAAISPARVYYAETDSSSTEEHPLKLRSMLGDRPFILVTSAYHMPRAMRAFQKADMKPTPYPVDYLSSRGPYTWADWLPSAESLWKLQIAVREYMALGYYALRGL